MIQYIIQPGDNLYTIGIRFKTSVSALMQANHIADPNMIYPGQILNIPLPHTPTDDISRLPDIRQGSSGPFVLLLQSRLARLGYYKGSLDGIYSPTTEGSVKQFQASRNLQPTGQADMDTWKHLLDDTRGYPDAPPYHGDMLLSGLFMLLSVDKAVFAPGQPISFALTKINQSVQTIKLNYNTSQRYDFKLSYPSGRTLWRWSDDKSFTQVLGSVSLAPGQVVRYTEKFTLPPAAREGVYHVFGWNTAKQINHIKLHVMIRIEQEST